MKIEAAIRLKAADDHIILKELSAMLAMKLNLKDLSTLSYRMASPGKMILRGPGTETVQTQKQMDQYGDHYKFTLNDIREFLDKHNVKKFKR